MFICVKSKEDEDVPGMRCFLLAFDDKTVRDRLHMQYKKANFLSKESSEILSYSLWEIYVR